jgi:hypothetical protein
MLIEWLKTHPLISVSGLEKACGLYRNAIRMDGSKPISGLHIHKIVEALKDYGYVEELQREFKIPTEVVKEEAVSVSQGTTKKVDMNMLRAIASGKTVKEVVVEASTVGSKFRVGSGSIYCQVNGKVLFIPVSFDTYQNRNMLSGWQKECYDFGEERGVWDIF